MKTLTQNNWTIKEPSCRTFKERTEIWIDGDTEMNFEILHNEKTLRETQANAKLIAAAPDLIDFVNHVAFCLNTGNQMGELTLAEAERLIKKATL